MALDVALQAQSLPLFTFNFFSSIYYVLHKLKDSASMFSKKNDVLGLEKLLKTLTLCPYIHKQFS